MISLISNTNTVILFYFIFSIIFYTLLLISAFPEILRFFKTSKYTNIQNLINQHHLPPMTIIMPAYNEATLILDSTLSALKSKYPNLYVIVVNDGSTDKTLDILTQRFELEEVSSIIEDKIKTQKVKRSFISKSHPNFMVIDKENGGAGDAINVGVNACATPYFMTMDADSIIHPEAITELMHYIITKPHVAAVGGGVYLLNGCQYKDGEIIDSHIPPTWVAALQSNEYLRSHLFNRTAWNRFNGTMSYSGTATAFSRQAVLDVNGFDTHNYAQDAEIIVKIHEYMQRNKRDYNIGFNPAVAVWTDVPSSLRSYTRQQDHWRRGILRSMLRHSQLFLNPRYGKAGMISYPIYIMLDVIAPLVEFTAYFSVFLAYYYGILNASAALMYVILAWGFSSYITMANAFINLITFNRYHHLRDILWTFGLAFFDMLGFRQYNTCVKIWGTLHYCFNRLRGKPL